MSSSFVATSPSPFITTTDVLNSLNTALDSLKDDKTTDRSLAGQGHFDLQRRLPDGSCRTATDRERAAADLQQMIQQAAAHVAALSSAAEKAEWAERQRQHGNQHYQQQQYEQAIDVYLTCLPAVMMDDSQVSTENQELFSKIMNNLAQSALQLSWYKKAERFCTMALEQFDSWNQNMCSKESNEQLAKLYYKRGKARRLCGEYNIARYDFERALRCLGASAQFVSERTSIEKEIRLLQKAVIEAKKNKGRTQRAVRALLLGENRTIGNDCAPGKVRQRPMESEAPLYEMPDSGSRSYSTIRAPMQQEVEEESDQISARKLSIFDWYLAMIGRVAAKLLEWIGDDEYQPQTRKED